MPPLVLAGYCLVMIAPALLLVLGRTVAAQQGEPLLQRRDRWSRRKGGEALLWSPGSLASSWPATPPRRSACWSASG